MSDINIQINVIAKAAQAAVAQLEKQTEQATKQFEQLQGTVNKTSLIFINFAAAIAKDIFVGLARGVGNLISDSVKLQIELEKLQTKFSSLTGSAESAKAILEELNEFSDSTPFEFPEIANAAQKLLTFGVNAKDVKDTLKVLGDISAASGANLEELALAFGKVSSAGFVTGRELSLFQNNAIPVVAALSEQLGVTTASVKKLANDGKISADQFEQALRSLGKEGGFAFQAMEKQGQTLAGSIKTLNDAFENLQKVVGAELSAAMQTTLKAVAGIINDSVVPAVVSTIKLFKEFKTLLEESTAIQAVLVGIAAGFTAIAVNSAIAAAAAISYTGIITALQAQLMLLQIRAVAAWVALTGPVGLAVMGIAAVSAAAYALYKNWDQVKLSVLEAWKATKEFFGLNTDSLQQQIDQTKALIAEEEKRKNGKVVEQTQTEELNELKRQQRDLNKQTSGTLVDLTAKTNDQLNKTKELTEAEKEALRIQREKEEARKKEIQAKQAALDAEIDFQSKLLGIKNQSLIEQQKIFNLENMSSQEMSDLALLQLEDGLAKKAEIEAEAALQKQIAQDIELNVEKEKLIEHQNQLALIQEQHRLNQLTRDAAFKTKLNDQGKKSADAEANLQRTLATQKENINKGYWGLAAALAKNGSKEQFAIQKAAAVAELWVARGKALGSIPSQTALLPAPAVGPATAALTANANTAFGIGLATVLASAIQGFEKGGIVGGNSFTGDNVVARVNSGEMILNRQQQAQLFQMVNSPSGGSEVIQTNITVELDGEVVARSVSRQVANGLKLGEVV